jgi:DNA-directed RNA polymerase specialized sigma24 family protein
LAELKQTQDWSWVAAFENSLELRAVVDEMDDWMKEVLYRWALDEPWDEISEDMGVTTNALKKRFFYHLKKIRNRILDANRTVSAMGCQLPRKSDLARFGTTEPNNLSWKVPP